MGRFSDTLTRLFLLVASCLMLSMSSPAVAQRAKPRIVKFVLIDTDKDVEIATITPGTIFNIDDLPTRRLTVKVVTKPGKVAKVVFKLDRTITDASFPYSLSDKLGDFHAYPFEKLTYNLTAMPYFRKGKKNYFKGIGAKTAFTFVGSSLPGPLPTATATNPPPDYTPGQTPPTAEPTATTPPDATPAETSTPTATFTPTPTPTNTPEPTEAYEKASPIEMELSGVNEWGFNPLDVVVGFVASGGDLSTNPHDTTLLLNGRTVQDSSLTFSSLAIAATLRLQEGRNTLELFSSDASGNLVQKDWVLWAGSYDLTVTAQISSILPVSGAFVKLSLGDDPRILAEGVSASDGTVLFQNLPDRTVAIEARTTSNLYGITATTGKAEEAVVTLSEIDGDSDIDNNDFSLDWLGWNVTNAPVEIVPHVERTTPVTGDKDGVLNTENIGSETISRTFRTKPGTKRVAIRYRFQTAEFPEFFGTKYNDYYSISIRTLLGGRVGTEGSSMNALGKAAFNTSGQTEWKEYSMPITHDQDVVHVQVVVANVGDGLYDSKVIIDKITEGSFSIQDLVLRDLDTSPLEHLSVSPHTYLGGFLPILGTLRIQGDPGDMIQQLTLEVASGGTLIAATPLVNAMKTKLLNVPFGESGELSVTEPELLFQLTPSQLSKINTTTDESVTLKVVAVTSKNIYTSANYGSVVKLIRYTSANRFGVRNASLGGDEWMLPSLKALLPKFVGTQWNNLSNMHGGRFLADHPAHLHGTDADGYFPGYTNMDAATATYLLNILNDTTVGPKISAIFVTYQPDVHLSFTSTLQSTMLTDGRRAVDVIRNWPGHEQFFHMRMKP